MEKTKKTNIDDIEIHTDDKNNTTIENVQSNDDELIEQKNTNLEKEIDVGDKPSIETENLSTQSDSQNTNHLNLQKTTEQSSEITEESKDEQHLQTEITDGLSTKIQELATMQQQIRKDFNEKLKYDEHKEQLINKLHKELQEYKDDVVKSAMKPIVNDLIILNDNIYKLVENFRSSDKPLDAEAILAHMEATTIDIDDVLYRQGIEPFNCPEEEVNPLKQQIFQTVKADDQTKEKKIAQRIRKGYEWDGQIIHRELVSVYVYDENSIENNQQDEGVDIK